MRKLALALLFPVSALLFAQTKYVMVIHGGAGTITRESMTPEKEAAYRQKLTEALQSGYNEIQKGKSAVEAVAASIVILEDSPLFNAGKGSVFTSEGKNEMDAAIMFGKDKSAGAVAGVHTIKNPIKAAIAVMQKSDHVMLSGRGAEEFAQEAGLEIVLPSYFWTKERWDGLQRVKQKENSNKTSLSNTKNAFDTDQKFGTVGAVALDKNGNLAAGTYSDTHVGISATGWGEYFIRATAARTVAAKMEYQNKDIRSATQEVIDEIGTMGGDGGLIALDKDGNAAMPFNTAGMYRGTVTEKGEIEVQIYK